MPVLVVDDDARLLSLLEKYLTKEGFEIITAIDTLKAREILLKEKIHAIVLDLMMPNETGTQFLKTLNNNSPPVLLLSARDSIDDKIECFESGVCDYLTKPFEPKELSLRIKSLINRFSTVKKIFLGNFVFCMKTFDLYQNDEYIKLSSTEKTLLKTLIEKKTCSRDELSKTIGNCVSLRTIDMQIARLRKKIQDYNEPFLIQTVRHVGYSIAPRKY